ncbi:MAG: type II secretion system protein [Nitrospirota bacterium]
MRIQKNTKGITMLEIVLVIIIFGISVGLSILYHQSSQIRADLRSQVSQFTSYVRLAHSNALSGLSNQSHGIHLETSSYTTFIGSSYDPLDEYNFVIDLPEIIEIQNISLNGGGNDIIFTTTAGETNNYGSVDFVSTQIQKTTTIEITKFGTVTY